MEWDIGSLSVFGLSEVQQVEGVFRDGMGHWIAECICQELGKWRDYFVMEWDIGMLSVFALPGYQKME